MKKIILTIVALLGLTTTSFAQFSVFTSCSNIKSGSSFYPFTVFTPCSSVSSVSSSLPSVLLDLPSVPSVDIPSVPISIPSSVNVNTTSVSGYYRSNGTYVDSYIRTMPNSTNWDNYSTSGNINPFTGSVGHRASDYSPRSYNYGSGHTIYTGPRGGQYYYNSNGNRVYVPKR